MAILTKQQLEALNQSSFPNNSTEAITPAILRDYNTAVIDSLVDSNDTGSFVPTNITALNQFTASQEALNDTFATTGSNTFSGDQTIQSDGTQNGIFYKTGSSEFFVGQRSNGNFAISSSAESRIIDINPQSGWVEHYTQNNFNGGVSTRGLLDARNITTQTGNGYVAQFDGFTASLQEGYAWVGKSGGTSVSVPTASFAGAAPVGVATTGSNTFVGAQYITEGNSLYFNGVNPLQTAQLFPNQLDGKFDFNVTGLSGTNFDNNIYIDGEKRLFIKRSNTGADQYLRLGATDNSYNFAFIVTGSDTNPGQQVWGINTAGGVWANSFDAGVVFNSYVTASQGINITNGTFRAPLQQGYVWVGDSNGRTTTVPTSSFGGGGTIVGYATTGSNTFDGTQTITNGGLDLISPFTSINMKANSAGSGSAYTGINTFVDVTTDPANVYSAFQLIDDVTQNTLIAISANSYTPQYPNTTIPMLFGGGNNPDGSSAGIAFPTNGQMDVWKKSNFKYGADITGSLKVTSTFTSSLQQGYTWVGGAGNVSKLVATSSFAGATINTGSFATTGSNTFNGSQTITGSINQRNGNSELNGNLTVNNAHLYINGVGDNTIQVTNGNISTNGQVIAGTGVNSSGQVNILGGAGLTIQANLQGSGSAYSIAGAFVDNTTDPTNVYSAFQLVDADTFKTLALAWNSYTPHYATSTPMIAGADQYNGSDVIFGFPTNTIDIWKPTTAYADFTIASGSSLYVNGHKQFNVGAWQDTTTQSGSANTAYAFKFNTTDILDGVIISGSTGLKTTYAGSYNIQWSGQLSQGAGSADVTVWLRKNGTNINGTGGVVTVASNSKLLPAWNYVLDLNANDVIEIMWGSNSSATTWEAIPASGIYPSCASIIATVTQVR
jgi:hypothetical protein